MSINHKGLLVIILGFLSGCAANQPTWLNHGHGTVMVEKSMIHCYTDASLIDGERLEGMLCATNSSGFLGDGEPELKFGPWGRKLIIASATDSLNGVERQWHGIDFYLRCEKILSDKSGDDIGRNCSVKANNQHLMSASYFFTPK